MHDKFYQYNVLLIKLEKPESHPPFDVVFWPVLAIV